MRVSVSRVREEKGVGSAWGFVSESILKHDDAAFEGRSAMRDILVELCVRWIDSVTEVSQVVERGMAQAG